jgi:hypothetical protein
MPSLRSHCTICAVCRVQCAQCTVYNMHSVQGTIMIHDVHIVQMHSDQGVQCTMYTVNSDRRVISGIFQPQRSIRPLQAVQQPAPARGSGPKWSKTQSGQSGQGGQIKSTRRESQKCIKKIQTADPRPISWAVTGTVIAAVSGT